MNWKPATIEEVQQIVERDLANCSREQVTLFEKYRVQPRLAPIVRSGNRESVVVVAQRGEEVIYWEDVEEGFEVSSVDSSGKILDPGCNQNDLRIALSTWVK
jgi:NADPH-dependent 7-cyano-7-deazaguanine reductase QueF-like protein